MLTEVVVPSSETRGEVAIYASLIRTAIPTPRPFMNGKQEARKAEVDHAQSRGNPLTSV